MPSRRDVACHLIKVAAISNASFVPLASKNHVFVPDKPACNVFRAELAAFLGQDRSMQPHEVRGFPLAVP